MSYDSVQQLVRDTDFNGRVRSCATEQAAANLDNEDLAVAGLAADVLRGGGATLDTFVRTTASAPGLGDKATLPNGTIDQSQVVDGDLLAAVQANFPRIAKLFFNEEGVRIA